MPSIAYDPRFLMLPVSPARSTDSQIDASSSSKYADEEVLITEAEAPQGSLIHLPTEVGSSNSSIIFRPTAWSTVPMSAPHPSSATTTASSSVSLSSQDSVLLSRNSAEDERTKLWTIQRSYAFDEDDTP